MVEWKSFILSEIADFSQGIQVDIDQQFNVMAEGRVRFIRIVDFTKGASDEIRYITNPGERYQVDHDDLVMIRYGSQTAGKIAKGFKGVIANNTFKITPKSNTQTNKTYLYYFLKQNEVYEFFKLMNASSTMPAITFSMAGSLELLLPPFPEQERIAEVLSSLDDKIDLLHRQNKTLEEMAETLFRQWFVEEAEDIKATSSIYEYLTVDYGYPFNSKLFNDVKEGLPLIRIRDIKDGSMNTFTTEETDKKYLVGKGDLLVGMDGEFRIHMWKGDQAWLNQRVCRVNPKSGIPEFFVINLLKPHLDFYEQTKGGTTVIHLGKSDLDEIKIPFYPIEKIEKYMQVSDPLFQKCKNNSAIINNLETLRDTLLPKLMSGLVTVNENE